MLNGDEDTSWRGRRDIWEGIRMGSSLDDERQMTGKEKSEPEGGLFHPSLAASARSPHSVNFGLEVTVSTHTTICPCSSCWDL